MGLMKASESAFFKRKVHDNDCEGSTDICCCYVRRELAAANKQLAEAEKVISTAEAAMCQATFMVGAGNRSDLNHAIDKTRAFLFAIAQGR